MYNIMPEREYTSRHRLCHGIIVNDPEDFRTLKESSSSLNESDKNFEESSFSVALFVDK